MKAPKITTIHVLGILTLAEMIILKSMIISFAFWVAYGVYVIIRDDL